MNEQSINSVIKNPCFDDTDIVTVDLNQHLIAAVLIERDPYTTFSLNYV